MRPSAGAEELDEPGRRDWWLLCGCALFAGLFAGALLSKGYAVDGMERAWAFAGCGLLGAWGVLGHGAGWWTCRAGSPGAWLLGGLAGLTAVAGLLAAPVPAGWAAALSPAWAQALADLEATGMAAPRWATLGVSPDNARAGFLHFAASTGFLAGTLALCERRRGALVVIVTLVAFSILQGWLGAIYSALEGLGRTPGIYYNPNHHAASTLAGLPLAAALAFWTRDQASEGGGSGSSDRTVFLLGVWMVALAGWLAALSRGSLLLSLPLLVAWGGWEAARRWGWRGEGRRRRWGWTESLLVAGAFVVVVAMSPVVGPYLDRVSPEVEASRASFLVATWKGFVETRGLGLGVGGAEFAISRFLEGMPARRVAVYTHNDWMQALAELGLLGVLVAGVCGAGWARSLGRSWRAEGEERGEVAGMLRRAAGAGVALLLAHALVEFHLRMPAIGFQGLALLALLSGRGVRWVGRDE